MSATTASLLFIAFCLCALAAFTGWFIAQRHKRHSSVPPDRKGSP